MIKNYFKKEELKKFNCKNCIHYECCKMRGSMTPIECFDFSPTADILYNKIEELRSINTKYAGTYTALRDDE